jgi:Nif11 domain
MSKSVVIGFLQKLVTQPELQNKLKMMPKSDVLTHAQQSGYSFTEAEFDDTVWNLEISLAEKLGEKFDLNFSLWETMWGNHYLEFVVNNVIDCFSEIEIQEFLQQQSTISG